MGRQGNALLTEGPLNIPTEDAFIAKLDGVVKMIRKRAGRRTSLLHPSLYPCRRSSRDAGSAIAPANPIYRVRAPV